MHESIQHLQGSIITTDQFGSEFDVAWEALENRFFKLECEQFYDEGPGGAHAAFVSEHFEEFVERLVNARLEDLPFVKSARERGVSLIRVHLVDRPLSKYVEFEGYSYYLSQKLGEQILLIDRSGVDPSTLRDLRDLVLFDNKVGFVQQYENGVLQSAVRVNDTDGLGILDRISKALIETARPFTELINLDPHLLARIEERLLSSDTWLNSGLTSSRPQES